MGAENRRHMVRRPIRGLGGGLQTVQCSFQGLGGAPHTLQRLFQSLEGALCPSGEHACAVMSRSSNLPGHLDERRTVEWQRRAVGHRDWRG